MAEDQQPQRRTNTLYAALIRREAMLRAMQFRRAGVRALAADIDVSRSHLSALCTGRETTCSPEVAARIEEGLHLAPGSLFALYVRGAAETNDRNAAAAQDVA